VTVPDPSNGRQAPPADPYANQVQHQQ
jgi:hypothetical protein